MRYSRLMIIRAIALFLGSFSLLNLALDLVVPGFDANIWWIDFRFLPGPLPALALVLVGATLLAHAIVGTPAGRWRWLMLSGLAVLCATLIDNVIAFYWLLAAGAITTGFPVPLSLFILLPVALATWHVWRDRDRPAARGIRASTWRQRGVVAITLAGLAVAFPLAQVFCFGCTDYRRPADAAVVFGARTFASGTMSTSLHDRIRTAVELYHAGLVRVLIVSGGPGDGDVHETEAMRRYAIDQGVPDSAIIMDQDGLDTQRTVDNTLPILRQRGLHRVLAVSQFYHLPRIKLTYLRAGVEVYTVPASASRPIPGTPYFILREVAALGFYYVRPLLPGG